MNDDEDPTCFSCGGVCAGALNGLWCVVCGTHQVPDPDPEKTHWELQLEAARERLLKGKQ